MALQTGHKSFGEQARHYFLRPQKTIPCTPLACSAAWMGNQLTGRSKSWTRYLNTEDLQQLHNAVTRLIRQGVRLEETGPHHFTIGSLAEKIGDWREQIVNGYGFILVKGLPVDSWSLEEIEYAYWGIGHHLGIPGAQNPDQELLGHVKDYGESRDSPFVRLYRTSANIDFHCDAADVVGLLCLQPAASGGQSLLVSTVTLFNRLLAEKPELVEYLFKPFKLDARGEHSSNQKPYNEIPIACFADDHLRTFYHSEYFRSVERLEGVSLSKEEREILDFYDETAAEPDVHLAMWLEKGDMQFISNHTLAHSRTAYINNPHSPRHLLRLWLSLP